MTSKKDIKTPLMKQYFSIKAKHPDAILLFRVGDFYETYGEDAVVASGILGITLTKRSGNKINSIELAGFPHHALDTYLPKLIRSGKRVAICDQLEDPKLTKKLVKRGITELVTPGVALNDNVLENKENNFLASLHFDKKIAGIAFLDISTGEFLTAEGTYEYIDKLLSSFKPKEVLFQKGKERDFHQYFGGKYCTYCLDDWVYTYDSAEDRLLRHFGTKTLKGFGVQGLNSGIIAAGAVLCYLDLTQHQHLQHITSLSRLEENKYVWLDRFTIRNLELFGTINEGAKTLIEVLDKTVCPMGARMLKRWISLPLKNIETINKRLSVVEYFVSKEEDRNSFSDLIGQIGDIERIGSKVAVGRVNPREMLQLSNALTAIAEVKNLLLEKDQDVLKNFSDKLNPCNEINDRIKKEISDNPPILLSKGNTIKTGFSAELDDLREISHSSKQYLAKMQQRESERTGIPSLKISYNNVFGYYIEVRNTHKDKVPAEWIRKQTLVNAERYITEELKDYESKILGAEEKILSLETKLFNDLVYDVTMYIQAIQTDANIIAKLDCLLSFSNSAVDYKYTKPDVNNSKLIDIKGGRHPVIEQQMMIGESYIANDVFLDQDSQQIIIITGPNMAGKSALLRQTALIVLMAQMGSFVPADSAKIGYVDKIFTRVGASDNISLGESTFMVEMHEAASILNNISDRSLILLDELGRGTSTYDGISIAWSIVEYIHENPYARAKTMFATHYHELNEMEKSFERVKNYNVTVKEVDKKVIFLRKLVRGGSNHSFGIHVAKMAGMPPSVVKRANEILKQLEQNSSKDNLTKPLKEVSELREGCQLSFFQLDDPVLKSIRNELKKIDINNLTPIQALNKLSEIKKISGLK